MTGNIGMSSTMSTENLINHQDQFRARLQDTAIIVEPQVSGPETANFSCCTGEKPEIDHHIPFSNVLWCRLLHEDVYEVTYAAPVASSIKIRTINLRLDHPIALGNSKDTLDLAKAVLEKAYAKSTIQPSVLVLINPHGGKGNAVEIYDKHIAPVLNAAGVKLTLKKTQYHGHATEIARDLDIADYDIVACCSGDGIPHEVINGFYARPDNGLEAFNKIAITQLPGGSGNALTLSTHGSNDAKLAAFKMLKAERAKIDLMALKQEDDDRQEKVSLSFLSQCYGAIADSDIGTEHLRWMGPIRFDLGVLHKVLTRAKYPCELYVDRVTKTKSDVTDHFNKYKDIAASTTELAQVSPDNLSLKGPKINDPVPSSWEKVDSSITDNISIFYVGNMPYVSNDAQFFPAALPNDGSMDMILTTVETPILQTASLLLSVDKGVHVHNDHTIHTKVQAYRLVPKIPPGSKHYISIDGEDFPFKPLQVEILPGIMTGLLTDGAYVETCFTTM